jgi:hypothetical protein
MERTDCWGRRSGGRSGRIVPFYEDTDRIIRAWRTISGRRFAFSGRGRKRHWGDVRRQRTRRRRRGRAATG